MFYKHFKIIDKQTLEDNRKTKSSHNFILSVEFWNSDKNRSDIFSMATSFT